ncbi:DUF3906 family protein [Microaerobacter geothermalis]|uniref:DUF3906 family protein n=1 Tax=Microaerobacter geothermalis TaxID=674972 RepID=UPI001F3A80C5|nr:DUF3906 family protein [Microaerobacter geothermalis]MCF6094231.1 DUF3906 family protein [Microaerobacter geothermalis]
MFLYKLEVRFADESWATVVTIAGDDRQAFESANHQLECHYLPLKKITEMAMVEKKPAKKGHGYVIEP